MLQTRLWMGAVLIVLAGGVLVGDQAPFPFLFLLLTGLACGASFELLALLPREIRPPIWLCVLGIMAIMGANWLPHLQCGGRGSAWLFIATVFATLVMLAFLVEMATFREAGRSVIRIALTVLLFAYVGLLPSFLAQLRWLTPLESGTAALVLTIFVPKCCDIGAYFTGRLIGRHKMTPVLSPKKTWEGAAGGLAVAVLTAILVDRLGPAQLLREDITLEIGFGVTVGAAGMMGDLAESLIKRDCQQKDASQAVPGFGGVLDVVDAILFAAPVSFVWLELLR